METADIPAKVAADWQPILDPHILAVLGKLGEELNEAASAVSRAIIQGLDETSPDTGKINRVWIEDELADVLAMIGHAVIHLDLDDDKITKRAEKKFAFKAPWFDNLKRKKKNGKQRNG